MPKKPDPRQQAPFDMGPPREKPRRPSVSVPIKGDVIEHEEPLRQGSLLTLIDTRTGHTQRAKYIALTGKSEAQLKWGKLHDGPEGDFVYLSLNTGRLKGGAKLSRFRVTRNCLRALRGEL